MRANRFVQFFLSCRYARILVPLIVLEGMSGMSNRAAGQPPNTCPDAATKGCWGSTISFDPTIDATHAILLGTGKVLIHPESQGNRRYQLLNPTNYSLSPAKSTQTPTADDDLFCSGHIRQFDGKVLFVGGFLITGNTKPSIYDPGVDSWNDGGSGDIVNLTDSTRRAQCLLQGVCSSSVTRKKVVTSSHPSCTIP